MGEGLTLGGINPEFLLSLIVLCAGAIFGYGKLQQKIESNFETNKDRLDGVEKKFSDVERRLERGEERAEQSHAEVRAVTLGIQKSLARLEGRLGMMPRHRQEDDER